VDDTYFTGW